MNIAVGSDEAGFALKEQVKTFLEGRGHVVVDVGCYSEEPVLYPDIAERACLKISEGSCERGVLCCGTGIGMAITANKVVGIRAAVGHDVYSVERSVLSNDCQVVTFGSRVVSYQYVTRLLDRWLGCSFVDGPSTQKVEGIMRVEQRRMKG